MKLLKRWSPLIIIFLLGIFLRFYKLDTIPNGLYQDETAIGYNAYSILQTGRDEHGLNYPLYFKSFGDYKLPVYIYLTTASIKLFGLSAWAVRFPSALFGSLTVVLLYFFLKELFQNQKNTSFSIWHWSFGIPEVGSLLLALNPWHLHYSRATFEVTIALFFFILGGLMLLHLPRRGAFIVGTLCFLVALYTYNLTRLLAPILYIVFLWESKAKIKLTPLIERGITLILSFIILIPFVLTLKNAGGAQSASGTFIFTSAAVQAHLLEFRSYFVNLPTFFTKLLLNQVMLTSWQYVHNIASYFSVNFFFLTGSPHGNHGIGNVGQFYLFELPLIILGIVEVLKQKHHLKRVLLGWCISTIAVAAFTREAPHATRSFFLLLPLISFSAVGLLQVFEILRQKRIAILLTAAFIAYNLIYYFLSYYVRFPIAYAASWRSADKPLAQYLKSVENQYDRIIIDTESGFIYTSLLFYQVYPPQRLLDSVHRSPDDSEGFSSVETFGKYEFREVNWEKDYRSPRTLIVTSPKHKPDEVSTLQSFWYPIRPVVIAVKQQIAQYPVEDVAYITISSIK